MKKCQEICDYLEIDLACKVNYGSELHLRKEDFTVILKAVVGCDGLPHIQVIFQPPESQCED